MRISPAEIIDRMSIVKLKKERIGRDKFDSELKELEDALQEFEKEGIEIKEVWLEELYDINSREWDLLEKMNDERKKDKDFSKIGQIYLETELVNKERSDAKNKIIEETGQGFKEIKKNHPSE